jgi:hypothetical protein
MEGFVQRQLTAMVVVCGTLWVVTLIVTFREKGSFLIATLLWGGLSVVFYTWNYKVERPKLVAEVCRYEAALEKNKAEVVRIQSDEMVEFEEAEDEGECYAFQVDENCIAFVSGQDFYSTAKFPNSDFSLVHIRDENSMLLATFIEKTGKKLKPVRKISAAEKSKMKVPDHLTVIEGELASLEQLLVKSAESSGGKRLTSRL